MKTLLSSTFATALLLISSASFAADRIVVEAVNYPLAYFAERIATDAFDVQYRIDPEGDPAFWKPGAEDIVAFQQADVILLNGATYEKWMQTATLPRSIMVDTSKGFSEKYLKVEGGAHKHGDGDVHSHAGTAFTTWLDFDQAEEQAKAIAEKFKQLAPGEKKVIGSNFDALKSDLRDLNSAMKKFGKKWGDQPLAASHPIYQYMARAYKIDITALEWEPEMKFTPEAKHDLEHLLAKHPAKWMIWEGKPTQELVDGIGSLGVKSVVFSPCANKPQQGDWLTVMKQNIGNLQAMLASES